jgi:hypothetical protein
LEKQHCAPNWVRPSATVPTAQTDSVRRVFGQSSVVTAHCQVDVPADRCHLPPGLHAPHMQLPPLCSASSRRPDTNPARVTAARSPATSQPMLPTSRHFRSTCCTCSHQPCTLPLAISPEEKSITPLPTVTVELPPLHSSPPSPLFPGHRRPPPLVLLRPHPPHP